ncbi:MAG: hypothetical protein IM638_02980 [Bacteroidetes bacterium]|nr:hypothetical protein [Bacteroidota bacterium]
MKRSSFLLAILIQPFLFFSDTHKSETYKFSADIEAVLEADTMPWKYQTGAVMYSFAGDYRNALRVWDKGMHARNYIPTAADSALLSGSVCKDAREYIINRSKTEQVIIINEAHHNARHRTFTRGLLEGLYKNGYRYLGLEAIFDTAINVRNFATSETGYYTNEPEFGNLIYEARRLGFTLFSYEASEGKNGKAREIEQAQHIHAFMKQHTKGKYLIHCGYDHVFENEVRNWEKAMAGRLKEYSAIDPLTIDQVKFSEKSEPAHTHYFVRSIEAVRPFVLLDKDNKVFNGISEPKQTDITVIHPLTVYYNQRPHWFTDEKESYVLPEKKRIKYTYPVLILAYRKKEYEQKGIPADLIELSNNSTHPRLYLKKGKYTLVVKNRDYQIVDRFDVNVK